MAPPTRTSIMLGNRQYFDPWNPDPSVITLEVLARGMQAPRFNNQTIRTITIAEHCLRVDRIAQELGDRSRWAMFHDAHEALVPWGDCLRPGKTDEMREVEGDVDAAIRIALGVPLPGPSTFAVVRTADEIALYFEAMLWQAGASDWARAVWPLTDAITGGERPKPSRGDLIERFLPLITPRPGECWRTEVEELLS